MNLLKETIDTLNEYGRTENDVCWVGNKDIWFDFEHFKQIANQVYDSGFGSQQVATDLLVVGENWWLERHEYDGSEWWEFKELPNKPSIHNKVKTVIGGMWEGLEEINDNYEAE